MHLQAACLLTTEWGIIMQSSPSSPPSSPTFLPPPLLLSAAVGLTTGCWMKIRCTAARSRPDFSARCTKSFAIRRKIKSISLGNFWPKSKECIEQTRKYMYTVHTVQICIFCTALWKIPQNQIDIYDNVSSQIFPRVLSLELYIVENSTIVQQQSTLRIGQSEFSQQKAFQGRLMWSKFRENRIGKSFRKERLYLIFLSTVAHPVFCIAKR